MDLSAASSRDTTLEHFVPRSLDGSNEASNVYACCRPCNDSHATPSGHALRVVRRHLEQPLDAYLHVARALLGSKS